MLAGSFFQLRPRANELWRIEDDNVERAAGRKHVTDVGEGVGLREFDANLVEVGVFLRQFKRIGVEIDSDHVFRSAKFLRLDRKAARVAAQVEHGLVAAERSEEPTVVSLVAEEAGLM